MNIGHACQPRHVRASAGCCKQWGQLRTVCSVLHVQSILAKCVSCRRCTHHVAALPKNTIRTHTTKLAASALNCLLSLFVTQGFCTCRRLSEAGKLQGGVNPSGSPTLDQKLEKKLGGFGQDSGVHPAQHKPKKGSQTPSQQNSAAIVPENRYELGTAKHYMTFSSPCIWSSNAYVQNQLHIALSGCFQDFVSQVECKPQHDSFLKTDLLHTASVACWSLAETHAM